MHLLRRISAEGTRGPISSGQPHLEKYLFFPVILMTLFLLPLHAAGQNPPRPGGPSQEQDIQKDREPGSLNQRFAALLQDMKNGRYGTVISGCKEIIRTDSSFHQAYRLLLEASVSKDKNGFRSSCRPGDSLFSREFSPQGSEKQLLFLWARAVLQEGQELCAGRGKPGKKCIFGCPFLGSLRRIINLLRDQSRHRKRRRLFKKPDPGSSGQPPLAPGSGCHLLSGL